MLRERSIISCMIFIVLVLICIILMLIHERHIYYASDYYKNNSLPFIKVFFNKGAYGEFGASLCLQKTPFYHKVLYNCYIPMKDNNTTEIDLILLSEKGIYVIENKYYGGWIFGDEASKNWCETFKGKKYFFYNPIKQNKTHIKYLDKILNIGVENYMSVITFNGNAVLKKISVQSSNVKVMRVKQLKQLIMAAQSLPSPYTQAQVEDFYEILFPYTQVTDEEKKRHIERIQNKYNSNKK